MIYAGTFCPNIVKLIEGKFLVQSFFKQRAPSALSESCSTCAVATYVRDVEGSKEIGTNPVPKIIISASGMATGGRILHHIANYGPDRRNTILFAGYQAGGTRGAAITGGARVVKMLGREVPINAEVANLHMLSAHADADEILTWLSKFHAAPRRTFITHGEPRASEALRLRIEEDLDWRCHVPEHMEVALLN